MKLLRTKFLLSVLAFCVGIGTTVAQNKIKYNKFEKVTITIPYIGNIDVTGNEEVRRALIASLGSEQLAEYVMQNAVESNWPDGINTEAKRKNYPGLIKQLKAYKLAQSGDVCILAIPKKQSKVIVRAFNLQSDFFIPIACTSIVSGK